MAPLITSIDATVGLTIQLQSHYVLQFITIKFLHRNLDQQVKVSTNNKSTSQQQVDNKFACMTQQIVAYEEMDTTRDQFVVWLFAVILFCSALSTHSYGKLRPIFSSYCSLKTERTETESTLNQHADADRATSQPQNCRRNSELARIKIARKGIKM